MGKLENLKWNPSWVSHLGCVKGCLETLGVEMSNGWLYGGTGHAFIINMHEEVCPSGPTAWRAEMLFKLGRNLGYEVCGVFGTKAGGLAEVQQQAWVHARDAIDQGLPCYGWELGIPEYYVVYGYDDVGYHYSGPGCDDGKGPKPWQELGDTEIGMVEMYSVAPGGAADDVTIVRDALAFALEHAQSPEKWIFPKYKAGLQGFDNWIQAVESGTAHGLGMWYNAALWQECRRFGVEFLNEARERIGRGMEGAFDRAIGHYELVALHLKTVSDLYPRFEDSEEGIQVGDKSRAAVEALKRAREAEAAGLQALAAIGSGLEGVQG